MTYAAIVVFRIRKSKISKGKMFLTLLKRYTAAIEVYHPETRGCSGAELFDITDFYFRKNKDKHKSDKQ